MPLAVVFKKKCMCNDQMRKDWVIFVFHMKMFHSITLILCLDNHVSCIQFFMKNVWIFQKHCHLVMLYVCAWRYLQWYKQITSFQNLAFATKVGLIFIWSDQYHVYCLSLWNHPEQVRAYIHTLHVYIYIYIMCLHINP